MIYKNKYENGEIIKESTSGILDSDGAVIETLGKHSRNLGYSKFHVANGFARCSNSRDERVRILDYVSKSKIYIPKDIFF